MDDHVAAAPEGAVRSPAAHVAVQVVRVLLAGALLVQVAAVLWLMSREGDLRSLVGDLRAGRVTVLEIGEVPATDGLTLSYGDDPGTVIRWRTADASWHVMRLDPTDFPASDPLTPDPGHDGDPIPPGGEGVAAALSGERPDVVRAVAAAYAPRAGTVPLRSTQDNPWQTALDVSGGLAVLVMLLTLIAGPQPRQATKWGWFWLYLAPAGLGMLAALAIDTPWSRRPAWRERRLTGWAAFGILLVAGCAWGPVQLFLETALR